MLRQAGLLRDQDEHRHGPGCGQEETGQAPRPVQRSTVHDVLRGPGQPLDEVTRTDMEARLGADFSDVRIHSGAAARASADEVGARAYTSGSHVVVGAGGIDRHTLAHELTHVIQQRQGPVAGTDNGGGLRISDPSDRFEREAEANARRVLKGSAPPRNAEASGAAPAPGSHIQRMLSNTKGQDLHDAETPPGYSRTPAAAKKVADSSGREDGKWRYAEHDIPGLGSKTTATTNISLVSEQQKAGNWQQILNSFYQVCPGCGDAANVESFEVDHQEAFNEIRDNLRKLAADYTDAGVDPNRIPSQYQSFFVVSQDASAPGGFRFEASRAAVNEYSNDLGNLMRICRNCNGATGKSDMDFLKWFEQNKFFGRSFLAQHLSLQGGKNPDYILARTSSGGGWGKAARDWFTQHHLSTLRKQLPAVKLNKIITSGLANETTARTDGLYARDPQMLQYADVMNRRNDAHVGVTHTLADYAEGATDYAPGSPARLTAQVANVFNTREARKAQEAAGLLQAGVTADSGAAHDLGRQAGLAGQMPDHRVIAVGRPDSEAALRAYMEGYAAGMQQRFMQQQGFGGH
ncbi:DUF4157 domain-containing protein [Streptomyces sp. ML-6]|uniref:eCIS core domain-containing protein n=1 Tax=Streptomyces sp. ML-6 TaxID=2982693 RepID=UPI0024C09098|nr:DUF4157 domain-containing protein [Streptomyces sp. ML-6]MDK0522841.1 DUF4157 domain-containing protein [Streptomyces sp. ML-6]